MIEVDVQMSADGVFVCHHDEKIGEGADTRQIWEMSEADLRAAGVATLQEIIDAAQGKVYLNLEIKEYSARDPRKFMQQLLALIEQRRMQDEVLFTSFRMDYIREAGWHVPTMIIRPDEQMQQFFDRRAFGAPIKREKPIAEYLPSEWIAISRATGYACSIDELNPRDLADIHKHNIFFSVYTITTEEEFRNAVENGARGLVCENPRFFAELRNSLYPAQP
jgi:glycerophosphoryl diester phosphodiesterase